MPFGLRLTSDAQSTVVVISAGTIYPKLRPERPTTAGGRCPAAVFAF